MVIFSSAWIKSDTNSNKAIRHCGLDLQSSISKGCLDAVSGPASRCRVYETAPIIDQIEKVEMNGIVDLKSLLKSMSPTLHDDEYIFCSVDGELDDYMQLHPIATFKEAEGLTLILDKESAINAGINFECVFRMLTLTVHSSLEAVGLTATIAEKLTSKGISANVIAAYYHDHIFVPSEKAEQALQALYEFAD